MIELRPSELEPEFSGLLERFKNFGGVLEFVVLETVQPSFSHAHHRAAALAGMVEIDRRLEEFAVRRSSQEFPVERFFRVHWDESRLRGERVNLAEFWGTDDVSIKSIEDRVWEIPIIDGYKTAFFHPPHGLRGSTSSQTELFVRISGYILGTDPERAEVYAWSTNWSNYFEAGHEWWGAFYWTVRAAGSNRITVIAASTTD